MLQDLHAGFISAVVIKCDTVPAWCACAWLFFCCKQVFLPYKFNYVIYYIAHKYWVLIYDVVESQRWMNGDILALRVRMIHSPVAVCFVFSCPSVFCHYMLWNTHVVKMSLGTYNSLINLLSVPRDQHCELNCRALGFRFYVRQSDRVIDGTPCGQNDSSLCVAGKCMVGVFFFFLRSQNETFPEMVLFSLSSCFTSIQFNVFTVSILLFTVSLLGTALLHRGC